MLSLLSVFALIGRWAKRLPWRSQISREELQISEAWV